MSNAGLELASMEVRCTFHSITQVEGIDVEETCIQGRVSVNGQVHYPHEDCKGTGKVPRFPSVRVPCSPPEDGPWHYIIGTAREGAHPGTLDMHCGCQGRGWTPSDRLEDWLEANRGPSAVVVSFVLLPNVIHCKLSSSGNYIGEGDTPLEALQQALLKVTA